MALSVSQGIAVSFNAVLNEMRKPANQWAESAMFREMERQGMINKESLGEQIEHTLDYRRNPGTAISAIDLSPYSLTKTEVLTAAQYDIAEIVAPIVWSKKQEAQNSTPSQKVNLVTSLIANGITSHDDILEAAFFGTTTNGFLGLGTLLPDNGQGTVGGINAGTETWWRNPNGTYVDDTDIEAGMTTIWNAVSKGSGSNLMATLIVSDGATQALFESTQQAQQRYVDEEELKAGFKILAFKTSRYVFSQYGTTSLYFLNKKSFGCRFSKEFFRSRGETQELPNAPGYRTTVYSAGQFTTNNKSRGGVLHL
jgi:hypothetical protein